MSLSPSHPLVSVVIPCYNAERHIEDAILSCLNQTYSNLEILLIDDGSSDRSIKIARETSSIYPARRLQIIEHPNRENRGVSRSRELGILRSKGEFIAFLDADDIFLPNKIDVQVKIMQHFPEVVLSHTGICLIGDVDNKESHEFHFSSSPTLPYSFRALADFLFRLHICNSSVLVRRSCIANINWTSDMLFQCEDWLLWTLLSSRGKFIQVPQKLTMYRKHSDSYSGQNKGKPLQERYARLEFLLALGIKSFPSTLAARAWFLALRTIAKISSCYLAT